MTWGSCPRKPFGQNFGGLLKEKTNRPGRDRSDQWRIGMRGWLVLPNTQGWCVAPTRRRQLLYGLVEEL